MSSANEVPGGEICLVAHQLWVTQSIFNIKHKFLGDTTL